MLPRHSFEVSHTKNDALQLDDETAVGHYHFAKTYEGLLLFKLLQWLDRSKPWVSPGPGSFSWVHTKTHLKGIHTTIVFHWIVWSNSFKPALHVTHDITKPSVIFFVLANKPRLPGAKTFFIASDTFNIFQHLSTSSFGPKIRVK